MLKLNELKPKIEQKARKRIGRGEGSGTGKTSGKGMDGQKSRSGYSRKMYFEGGQNPLARRLPKRGFTNRFRVEYTVVNIEMLENIQEDVITPGLLLQKGLIKSGMLVKILGNGNLTKAKEIHANSFSKSAEAKITEAKGKIVKL